MKKNLKYKKYIILFVCCFIFSCIFSFAFCVFSSPKIEIDEDYITLFVGEKYKEPEYHAYAKNKDVTDLVTKKGKVHSDKLGTYTIQYDIKYSIFESKKNITVDVIDKEAPKIELVGDSEVLICPNASYQELGYKAYDNYDGDLTDKVMVVTQDDEIIYQVSDSSSNDTKVIRKIVSEDKEKPTITLKGEQSITLYVGGQYEEHGYSASDNCDGDISSLVQVSSNVDTSSVGDYTVTYKVKDSFSNEDVVVRNVKVIKKPVASTSGGRSGVIYLTFDDGPNVGTTNVILDILRDEGVSATFFVTCNGPDYLIQRMANEGHTVALHTASHNYQYIYASEANYFADLQKISNRVESITGQRSMIVRFPGGSSNKVSRFNPGIMSRLTREVINRGYHYFDWNVDSNDAAGASTEGVYSNTVSNLSLSRSNVVLMHDVKSTTRDALRRVIRYGKSNGYVFDRITDSTAMVTHGVNN